MMRDDLQQRGQAYHAGWGDGYEDAIKEHATQLAAKDAENKRLREALRQARHTMTKWLEPQIARIADAITIIDAALKEDTNG